MGATPDQWTGRPGVAPGVDESEARRGYHGSSDLLAKSGSADGGHLVNRLVFSHQVTALEAYLGTRSRTR
jgi:hypothetical protein